MASMKIEVVASSSPFHYTSLRDHNRSPNIKGYIHPPQCVRKNQSEDGDQDDDESWLPTSSQNSTVTSDAEGSNHRKEQNDVDDSWLPTVNDTNGKYRKNTNEAENDIDYSWLPSTFIDNNKNKIKQKNDTKSMNIKTNAIKNKNSGKSNTKSHNSPQKRSRNEHWALAREVVFSCDQQNRSNEVKTSDSKRLQQENSPSKSRYVVESPTSGGVSSLLQRWKDLAEVKNSNKNGNSSPCSNNRTNLGSTCKENKSNNSSQSPPSPSNESNGDWKSDIACRRLSCPLPSRDVNDSNPGGAEKEKIRVVDIIKRLSREEELAAFHGGNANVLLPPIHTNLKHKQIEGEQNAFKGTVKVSRHLIRGRQAFNNFLMQMEHDKHHELKWLVERKAVSEFSHRGRIQALLRFKILRLGVKAEPKPEAKRHRRCISKTLESNNRLDIMDLRERFNCGVEKEATESSKDKINAIKNTVNEETPATPREVDVKNKSKIPSSIMKQESQLKPEPMTPKSTQDSTSSSKEVVHKARFADSSSNSIIRKENGHYKNDNKYQFYDDEGQFESARTSYSQMENRGLSDLKDMNYTNKNHAYNNFNDWMTSESSQTRSDFDDDESNYGTETFDTNYDWISDISRPKSDWEDMRQARYQVMSLGNGDIRRLLERKSVSSFLGSGLRDLMDQLMMNRIQQSHEQVEKQVVAREKVESRKEEGEQADGSTLDDDGDCRSRTDTKCSEYSEYVDQTSYSERSWRPNDSVYNSETATTTTATTSPSLEWSSASNRSPNNSTPQSSPATTHQTNEMELVYDLRGHMEQLHLEIMELQKSIKSCVNMQVKMQYSFKQHVVANAATCSATVHKKERKPPGLVKHDCSICGDMQVDSLFYRCGHMCTCFKCAVELQRTSGECPVCEAPIVDVVKASVH